MDPPVRFGATILVRSCGVEVNRIRDGGLTMDAQENYSGGAVLLINGRKRKDKWGDITKRAYTSQSGNSMRN
jgi:hypothetical protein